MKKTWRKDLTVWLWCDIIANVRVREELRIPFKSLPVPRGLVRVAFSATNEQQEKELRFRYSRVVRFRPRDAFFFSWHLTFDLILLLLNWLRNNPWCAYDLVMTETTIGRGDAPTLPPSGLWSSEKGLGRLSTHVRPCEFGGSTAGSHGERI